MPTPGLVLLFGSGETSPSGGKILQALAPQFAQPLRIGVLETPAGFELNSAQVAGRVADFMRAKLQNYAPAVDVIPARQRGTDHSPDDPALAARLLNHDVIFLGPGSPTYAARQLRDSVTWEMLRARHRLGATLILASAATLALSAHVLPVYEIYKVGQDLHWQPGLNFFAPFGLPLIFIPHWNNTEGGADLDTSHCYVGASRFAKLLALLPASMPVVGLDEHTALVLDFEKNRGQVMGSGGVTILHDQHSHFFPSGETFPLADLGPFHLPNANDLSPAVWAQATAPPPRVDNSPSADILTLVETRQAARARKDWPAADAARQQLTALGWEVQDTPEGAKLRRLTQ